MDPRTGKRRPARQDAPTRQAATDAVGRARKIPPPPERHPDDRGSRAAGSTPAASGPEVWVDEGPVGERAPAPARRKKGSVPTPDVDVAELAVLVGVKRARTLANRLADAAVAFAEDRYPEARRILRPIVEEAPASVTARELLGLTQYRLGNWREAAKQLEEFRRLSGNSTDQHPVLADCYRALRKYKLVDELWAELREASPSAELVSEGRIVAAGSLADRGRLADAVAELERGWSIPKRARPHHLRRAYALADLQERAGDLPKARALMGWVATQDPRFADAAERARSMR